MPAQPRGMRTVVRVAALLFSIELSFGPRPSGLGLSAGSVAPWRLFCQTADTESEGNGVGTLVLTTVLPPALLRHALSRVPFGNGGNATVSEILHQSFGA